MSFTILSPNSFISATEVYHNTNHTRQQLKCCCQFRNDDLAIKALSHWRVIQGMSARLLSTLEKDLHITRVLQTAKLRALKQVSKLSYCTF